MVKNVGEACSVCWPAAFHDKQLGGTGWLHEDGTAVSPDEMRSLAAVPSPHQFAKPRLVMDGDQCSTGKIWGLGFPGLVLRRKPPLPTLTTIGSSG